MADLLAEFADAESLAAAIRRLRASGLRDLEAFTPYETSVVQDALGMSRPRVPLFCLVGGVIGGAGAFLLQWWLNAFVYPLDVGGRPLDSFPAFIPITFEGMIFGAAIATVGSFLLLTGLPRLWHPVFEVEGFERATIDRFFLRVGRAQPGYDGAQVQRILDESRALRLHEVGP